MTKTIKVPQNLRRSGEAVFDPETKSLRLSISSDVPYKRYDFWNDEEYFEVLDHSEKGVDLSRLKQGAALLYNHKRDVLLGTLSNPTLENGRCYVDAKISAAADVESYRTKVEEGVLKDTSIGYEILDDGVCIGAKDDCPIYKFRFAIHEASLVTIPADPSVGVGRQRSKPDGEPREIAIETKDVDIVLNSEKTGTREQIVSQKRETKSMDPIEPPVVTAPAVDVVKERENAVTSERARISGIKDIETHLATKGIGGRKIDVREAADQHIRDGKTLDEFRQFVMTNEFKAVPVRTDENGEIGLEQKDIRAFSLLRACRILASGKELDGLEGEVSRAALKASGIRDSNAMAIYLPPEIMNYDPRSNPEFNMRDYQRLAQRINNVTSGPAGGYTVGTDVMPMIELLRNKTVLERAGMTELTGLTGDILFPTLTQGLTAYWVSETGELTDSEVVFGQKVMTPHRLGATTGYTTQFLAQSSLSVEQFFRNELMTAIRLKLDNAGLEGTGVDGEPLGVKNTPGINATVTFGGAAVWADIIEFETGIEADNADIGSMAFIISVAAGGKWKQALVVTAGASGDFLIMNDRANGYPVYRTNQVTGDIVFFGVWSQLIHGTWATQEIIVDPYRLKKAGQIEITANTFHDFLVRQPLAFNVSTDSGAS